MPRVDQISLTSDGLNTPAVDHLSNKGTLNIVLDWNLAGLSAKLTQARELVVLFINFCRLTTNHCGSTMRPVLSSSITCQWTISFSSPRTCARSTTWRTALAQRIERS
jgi:hypothetical protein